MKADRVAVVLEHRYRRTPDGAVWTDGPFPASFFERYLARFDRVLAVARVEPVDRAGRGWLRADSRAVQFADVPSYRGFGEYLRRRGALRRAVRQAVSPRDALILRIPSQVAVEAVAALDPRAFAAEVVGDPWEAFAPGAVDHPLRAFFRRSQSRTLRSLCRRAAATAYVTEQALQRRYPPRPDAFTTHYSSVELPEIAFAKAPRAPSVEGPRRLVTVGSLEHLYKGQDVLLRALARLPQLQAILVGGGAYTEPLRRLAAELGVAGRVDFRGPLPSGEAVRAELDAADLFVLPSRQEGLPRALLEAMARGLPAVASGVGGIPEVLPSDDLVPAGDPVALAAKLAELVADSERLARMAARNLERSRDFRDHALAERRNAFYERVARLAPGMQQSSPSNLPAVSEL